MQQKAQNMINNLTRRYNEVERILETYHDNFSRITAELESIGRTITINDILLSKAWIEEGPINKVRHHHPHPNSSGKDWAKMREMFNET